MTAYTVETGLVRVASVEHPAGAGPAGVPTPRPSPSPCAPPLSRPADAGAAERDPAPGPRSSSRRNRPLPSRLPATRRSRPRPSRRSQTLPCRSPRRRPTRRSTRSPVPTWPSLRQDAGAPPAQLGGRAADLLQRRGRRRRPGGRRRPRAASRPRQRRRADAAGHRPQPAPGDLLDPPRDPAGRRRRPRARRWSPTSARPTAPSSSSRGSRPRTCSPGIGVRLIPGAIIDLGEGVTIQVTRA